MFYLTMNVHTKDNINKQSKETRTLIARNFMTETAVMPKDYPYYV